MTADASDAPPPTSPMAPKQDPETLVLRGRPRPAVRFRKGVIVGVAGAFSSALVALSWFALEPPSFRAAGANIDERGPFHRPPLDALAKAPANYGDVPRLGPPLPGDLGRPILERQREMAVESQPVLSPSVPSDREQRQAMLAEQRMRELAALQAARSSAVMVQLAGAAARGPNPPARFAPAGAAAAGETAQSGDGEDNRQAAFDRRIPAIGPNKLRAAPSPWTVSAGTIISASLITGLNSDLPGTVIAQVTEPVRDTATGRTVLIPQGARLIGSYDNRIAYGQKRALLAWERIVFPDASSIALDKLPASDRAGFSGLSDRVDFHTGRLLAGIALSTLLGIGTQLSLNGENELVQAVRASTQEGAARAGDRITQRNLDIQPTVTVRPGWPVRAIVNQDLVLQPWRG